ncbi:Scramblase-domain-containing protein [Pyronema omphalodes]|nr:Scramblase-domain-containing protein [Pyronema omphalodes]
MFTGSIARTLRASTVCRSYSSLRSTRAGPAARRTVGRRPPPSGIPVNATKASQKLLEKLESSSQTQNAPESQYNSLLTPVHIPEDPGAVIKSTHPAARLLDNSALVVQRKLELGNIILGFEQANKYVIMDPQGNHVGYIAEEDSGFGQLMVRQWAKTHRAFTTHVFDKHGVLVLKFHRPFSFINSRITAYDPIDPRSAPGAPSYVQPDQYRIIGECQQEWHMLRRKYNLFLYQDKQEDSMSPDHQPVAGGRGGVYKQFAYVDEPVLSWDFSLLTDDQPPRLIGSVNRNFAGFAREIFTDTGVYALRMDAASVAAEPSHLISNTHQQHEYRVPLSPAAKEADLKGVGEVAAGRGMTLDERATMLATAVSIDFDYFSRHSSMGHGGIMPVGVFGGGGGHDVSNNNNSPGIGDAVGMGMMGGAMGSMMGGGSGGYYGQPTGPGEQVPPGSEYPADPQQGEAMYPYEQPPEYQQPLYPPAEEEDGGSIFDFFDEED